MSETSAFNPAAIERLFKLGGQKFTLDMIDLFFSYGAQKMAAAHEAWQAGNLVALAAAAHPLKSSAGNVGAGRVQELAGQVELSAQDQNAVLAGTQLDELEHAFAESKSFLAAERTRLAQLPS